MYNPENIARVRRDEERARATAQKDEAKKRDEDAADRLRLLRGENGLEAGPVSKTPSHSDSREHKRKRSREPPEQITVAGERRSQGLSMARDTKRIHEDNVDLAQISNMRFKDAAGRDADSQTPWYTARSSHDAVESVGRDVWGNEDIGRKLRDQKRLDASDPLLAMKKGVKRLREVEQQKMEWRAERERDLHEVEDLARREERARRKRRRKRRREDEHGDGHGDDRGGDHGDDHDRVTDGYERHHRRRKSRSQSRDRSKSTSPRRVGDVER